MSSEAPHGRAPLHGRPGGLEGVMMRGASTWAVAVRTPDGEIEVDVHEVPGWAEKWSKIPLVRGVMALAESLALGYQGAHVVGEPARSPRRSRSPRRRWAGRSAVALVVLQRDLHRAARARGQRPRRHPRSRRLLFHVVEGALRLGIFLGYLLLIGQLKDIKRVFQYHGAEHKAIAAYENDVELTPESAQQFDTAHVRCGTNFLLTVMVDRDRRVLVRRPARPGRCSIAVADRADAGHRRLELRGDPLRGQEHAAGAGCAC